MASGISTIFLSSYPDELRKTSELLLQEKHGGKNSDMINEDIFALIDKLLNYNRLSKKQHKQILI